MIDHVLDNITSTHLNIAICFIVSWISLSVVGIFLCLWCQWILDNFERLLKNNNDKGKK